MADTLLAALKFCEGGENDTGHGGRMVSFPAEEHMIHIVLSWAHDPLHDS